MESIRDGKAVAQSESAARKDKALDALYWAVRVLAVFLFVALFVADLNPARITTKINRSTSLFTSCFSRARLTMGIPRYEFLDGFEFVSSSTVALLSASCVFVAFGAAVCLLAAGASFGNNRVKNLAGWFPIGGAAAVFLGLGGIYLAYTRICSPSVPPEFLNVVSAEYVLEEVPPYFPWGFWLFFAGSALIILFSAAARILLKRDGAEKKFKFGEAHLLFLYAFPVILLTFLFSYLPLLGWRYAFFNYDVDPYGIGGALQGKFTFAWFSYLFSSGPRVSEFLLVVRNTLVMSALGIASGFLPVAFAVFFSEINNKPLKKIIQTVTTLPNFISWILIYAVALTLFSTEGLWNNILSRVAGGEHNTNWLMDGPDPWLRMLAWGIWKGVGWSAIIYLAAIAGIDQELYEAASIDGARRFKKMWYITVPSLLPTFSVLLMLAFAGMLSNGLEQYLVFSNSATIDKLNVLDLYIYNRGLGGDSSSGMIPLATVISIGKSVISVLLLFLANRVSKFLRGESII
ncbi:MAG: ABC transporter permease subunit [Clostridiales bacterium]|jgi:putative aldouronate transport system permease protein|nr:ABC transporter permease subunit [Clostridiales bacterium]